MTAGTHEWGCLARPHLGCHPAEPRTGGMAAALPYCDALVSGHSLMALTEVLEEIGARR